MKKAKVSDEDNEANVEHVDEAEDEIRLFKRFIHRQRNSLHVIEEDEGLCQRPVVDPEQGEVVLVDPRGKDTPPRLIEIRNLVPKEFHWFTDNSKDNYIIDRCLGHNDVGQRFLELMMPMGPLINLRDLDNHVSNVFWQNRDVRLLRPIAMYLPYKMIVGYRLHLLRIYGTPPADESGWSTTRPLVSDFAFECCNTWYGWHLVVHREVLLLMWTTKGQHSTLFDLPREMAHLIASYILARYCFPEVEGSVTENKNKIRQKEMIRLFLGE